MNERLLEVAILIEVNQEDTAEVSRRWQFYDVISIAQRILLSLCCCGWNREAWVQELVVIQVAEFLDRAVCHQDVATTTLATTVCGIKVSGVLQEGARGVCWFRAAPLQFTRRLNAEVGLRWNQFQLVASRIDASRSVVKCLAKQFTSTHKKLRFGVARLSEAV